MITQEQIDRFVSNYKWLRDHHGDAVANSYAFLVEYNAQVAAKGGY